MTDKDKNMKDVVISLFDVTGKMVHPWLDAGYECWIVDLQAPAGIRNRRRDNGRPATQGTCGPDAPVVVSG